MIRVSRAVSASVDSAVLADTRYWFLEHPTDLAYDGMDVSISGNELAGTGPSRYYVTVALFQHNGSSGYDQISGEKYVDAKGRQQTKRLQMDIEEHGLASEQFGTSIESRLPLFVGVNLQCSLWFGDPATPIPFPSWASDLRINVTVHLVQDPIR